MGAIVEVPRRLRRTGVALDHIKNEGSSAMDAGRGDPLWLSERSRPAAKSCSVMVQANASRIAMSKWSALERETFMLEAVALIRGAERILIVAGAFFCLWLSLKFDQVGGTSEGKFKWDKASVELKKIGPSIFFAVFGVGLLAWSLAQPLTVKLDPATGGEVARTELRYLSPDASLFEGLDNLSKEIGRIGGFTHALSSNQLTPPEREELLRSIALIGSYRKTLFEARFGPGSYAQYEDFVRRNCESSKDAQCERLRAVLPKDFAAMGRFGVL